MSIYLDHAATTPVRPEVRDAMLPYLGESFGNPSSSHRWGRSARSALEEARERIGAALGAARHEIFFTACGTEADNLAVLGRWRRAAAPRDGVVCSAIEHKAVLAAAQQASREGAVLTLLAVDENGLVDVAALEAALSAPTSVVSVMWGNNEIGTVQPVRELAERCRNAGVMFHSDAVQAYGKVRVRVDDPPVDMLALGAHKFGGPKGIGVLYVRDGVEIEPLAYGGGQENELRPGTENVAFAVGFATAVELAERELPQRAATLACMRDEIESAVVGRVPDAIVNGRGAERMPHISNITVPGVDQEALLVALDLEGVAVSVASACQSGAAEPSHVLAAIGGVVDDAASIRVSVGYATTDADVRNAVEIIPTIIERVRAA